MMSMENLPKSLKNSLETTVGVPGDSSENESMSNEEQDRNVSRTARQKRDNVNRAEEKNSFQ